MLNYKIEELKYKLDNLEKENQKLRFQLKEKDIKIDELLSENKKLIDDKIELISILSKAEVIGNKIYVKTI